MAFGTYNCDYLLRESASSSWAVSAVLRNAGLTGNKGQLGCQCLHRLANETSLPVSSVSKEHVENTRALGPARCFESPGGHGGQASEHLRCHMSRLSSLNLRWASCSADHLDRNPHAGLQQNDRKDYLEKANATSTARATDHWPLWASPHTPSVSLFPLLSPLPVSVSANSPSLASLPCCLFYIWPTAACGYGLYELPRQHTTLSYSSWATMLLAKTLSISKARSPHMSFRVHNAFSLTGHCLLWRLILAFLNQLSLGFLGLIQGYALLNFFLIFIDSSFCSFKYKQRAWIVY